MQSQKLDEPPICRWFVAKKNGVYFVETTELCFVARLAEVCTHVAAILFLVEMPVKFRDCKTVTDIKTYSALNGKGH